MGQTSLCGIRKKENALKSLTDLSLSSALEFMVEFRSINIISPLETCFYILTFGTYPKKLTGERRGQAPARREDHRFRYKATLEDLNTQFIFVQLLDSSKTPQVVARQRIPLSAVVTGPTHYDYRLDPPQHRILLEIVMSQIITLCFHAMEMLFELDELPDQRVCQPSLRLMEHQAGKEHYAWGEALVQEWTPTANRIAFHKPLCLRREVNIESVNLVFFELRLWKRNEEAGVGGELIGEAEFEASLTLSPRPALVLTEPLRYRGRRIGRVTINTVNAAQPMVQQRSAGTLIDGVLSVTEPLVDTLCPSDNSDLNAIVVHLKQLRQLYRDWENIPRWADSRERFEAELLPCYASLEAIGLRVHNKLYNAFRYRSQQSLEEGQKLFLAVLDELLRRYNRVEAPEDRPFYRLLLLCLDRGELRCDYLKQAGTQREEILTKYDRLFRAFLVKALEDVGRAVSSEARTFSICLLARAYFRNRTFRREMLSRLPDTPPVGTVNEFAQSLFGWDAVLQDAEAGMNEDEREEFTLQARAAAAKMLKDAVFLLFFAEWVRLVRGEAGRLTVNWFAIEGFQQLLRHFTTRFIVLLPADPEPVLPITLQLVRDPLLFLHLSNAAQDNYDVGSTRRIEFTFSLLNKWCVALREERMSLPLRFRAYWVTAQLERHSAEDRAFPLFEVLNFIYLNFDIFSVNVKTTFVRRFVHRHFELAVHWNGLIRKLVALLFSFRFLHHFETHRVECDADVLTMLRKMRCLQAAGCVYSEALTAWERRPKAEKRRTPLKTVEAAAIAQLDSSSALLVASPFGQILADRELGQPTEFPALTARHLVYCQQAYSYFLSSYEAYLRSEYRSSGDEKELFNLIYAGGHDKFEFREDS